jgi:hypothetical protein
MQVFSTLHLLELPSSRWQQAVAVSGWSGALSADSVGHTQQQPVAGLHLQAASPGGPLAAAQLQEQTFDQQQQQQPAAGQGQHEQQQLRRQCQQVSSECMVWAGRPQFKLTVGRTCEVVLSLGQLDKQQQTQVKLPRPFCLGYGPSCMPSDEAGEPPAAVTAHQVLPCAVCHAGCAHPHLAAAAARRRNAYRLTGGTCSAHRPCAAPQSASSSRLQPSWY